MYAERKALALALLLATTSWLLDACVHHPGAGDWLRAVFLPTGYDLSSRLLVAGLFLLFGLITGRVLRQRRLAQDQLRESHTRYERLFEHAPDAMWELDPGGLVIRANLAMAELAGLPKQEIIGHPCDEILRSPACHTARCPLQSKGAEQDLCCSELLVERQDQRQAMCLVDASALYDARGQYCGVIEAFRNITEQRRTEARFEALVETTGDAITVIDPQGVITYANRAFCEALEYASEDLLGRKSVDLCDEANRELLRGELLRRRQGIESEYELCFTARSGRQVPWMVTATALLDEAGQYSGSFAVMKDITEQKLAADRVAHLNSVLLAVRDVNQLITRERNPQELLRKACECLTETRGYEIAYIETLDGNGELSGMYGAGHGYDLDDLDPRDSGARIWEIVNREGEARTVILGPEQAEWSEGMRAEWEAGRTCMAIRLEYSDRRYGYLATSLPAALAQSEDERSLFEEVAGDIAFALYALETEVERDAALDTLELTQYSVDHASDLVFWSDVTGRLLYANEAACRSLDYPKAQLEGMYLWEFDQPLTPERWPELWQEVRDRGTHTFESVHLRRDGEAMPVEVTVNYLQYHGQEYHFAFARNISGRKRAQTQLQRLNSQYRLLVESQLVETFILQRDRLVFANSTMHQRCGYGPGELEGANPLDLIAPEMREQVLEWNRRRRSGEGVPDAFEAQVVTKTGALRWVQVWAQETPDFEGAPAIIGHMVDVSEVRELRSQLEHSQRLESLGTLAGGVAHEFNNVLQAILLNASLLQVKHALPEADADKLKTIMERTEYGARLTDQLLTFSRRTPVEYGPLNLNSLLDETKRLLDRTMPRQIRIRLQQAEDLWMVQGDGGRLKQVFINLALNARDAMPGGGELLFESQNVVLNRAMLKTMQHLAPGPYVLIRARDTGTGMDQQTLGRVFEPFFTTKGVGQGTGLGLSIVHGIIDTHGGAIRPQSRSGEGTVFSIYLPAQPDLVAEDKPVAETPTAPGGRERILLVDDEADVVRATTDALSRYGYRVSAAPNGHAALTLVSDQPSTFDLVILDLIMPGLSGQETLLKLRQISPQLRILVASGYMPQIERDSHITGASGYLEKPFSLDRLLETVRLVLDQPPGR